MNMPLRRCARFCCFLIGIFSAAGLHAAEWRIAESPLRTPWAEKVDPNNVLPEYPRPLLQRNEWLNLNGVWQFQQAEAGDVVPLGKQLEQLILVPFPWESALSGIRKQFDSRRAWYRREFSVPAAWRERRVLLNFGAVDWEATVYVNGRCAGMHRGGYDPFSVDITPLVGYERPNELIVGVFDPGNDEGIAVGKQSNGKFTKPEGFSYCPSSGIWQTVWLEPVGEHYIRDLHTVPDVDQGRVAVSVDPDSHSGGLTVEVVARDGREMVGRVTGKPDAPILVPVPQAKLWTPDNPQLYDLEITLRKGERVMDRVASYFGMRKVGIQCFIINGRDGLMKIVLNGVPLFQMGPLDQGFWPDGIYTAPTDEALRWDIEQMKRWGFNMVRKHIKVEPQRWYYWCDKLGLLVWQDMPSTFKRRTEAEKTQFEWELQRMVKTHWNHPSIVNWIVFNEHWGAYDVERLTAEVMAIDPSRLITANSGIDAGAPNLDYEVGHIKDAHHYRPPTNPAATTRRAAVNGEYGAIGYKMPGHIWHTQGPWVHDSYRGKEDATAEYERFIDMVVQFKKEDHLCGAVYTQWTDVESETNGLYTYDRRLPKLDPERVTKANRSTCEEK
jgi:beta-galactosidase/beta-glucuronidase